MPTDKLYEVFINGKQTRLPFDRVKGKNYVKVSLINIHTDVCDHSL